MKSTLNFSTSKISNLDRGLAQKNRRESKFLAGLGQILSSILSILAGNEEPQISQKRDRSGEVFWRVYDPTTGESARFNSELEVRFWLEQRYYH
ncbi:hypothetical protein H6F93_04260 [Leptolyngbya sp. FACHB-671]|uniref:hypothetical protein n=1 Tax=Leptolyngbya sp. FACHB-671 TaxID=2692812 RepID=UPI00168387EB|nr:hypothetical protein [Leptolyngbya sp. FACHB-671]MBD2066745.1 hypothetical protein [Leptolyngbya sp. FACHB-671]